METGDKITIHRAPEGWDRAYVLIDDTTQKCRFKCGVVPAEDAYWVNGTNQDLEFLLGKNPDYNLCPGCFTETKILYRRKMATDTRTTIHRVPKGFNLPNLAPTNNRSGGCECGVWRVGGQHSHWCPLS